MKVAMVSTIPVFPTTEGNRRRILNLGRALKSLGHEVHFLFLPSRYSPDLDRLGHEAEFGVDRVTVLDRKPLPSGLHLARRGAMRAIRRAKRVLRRRSAFYQGLDELYLPDYTAQLRMLQAQHSFEAVMVEYIFASRAFEAFPDAALRILDTHDSFADRHLAVVGAASERDYWFSVSQDTECRAFRRADIVLAIQEEEARVFAARLGRQPPRVQTVSHIVDLSQRLDRYDATGGVFVGSANGPNLLSLRYFLQNTLPLIVADLPDFRLHVVGAVAAHIPDHPHVIKCGRVPDLVDAYRRAPLALNPMEAGTGINIKLLDAMAAGVATVSTATGCRGLGAAFAGGVVVVPDSDPRAFADAVITLSISESERARLGALAYRAAQAWNAQQHAWLRAALAPIEATINEPETSCASPS